MDRPLLSIKQGKLKGKILKNYNGEKYYAFKGIPYAKAPKGDLRFKAPVPPEPWTGTRNATNDGAECPQNLFIVTFVQGDEDNCLNLNVYTKKLPKEDEQPLLPVMVWIHGGGFVVGSNKFLVYNPSYLMMEDVVVVAINYRLGLLGFLSVEDESLDIPGNAGLKDQIMALKWIQENIKSFGGDPDNVTIFGESAGGSCVHYLMLSPLAKGLFHKAIIQSGCALNFWAQGTKGTVEICRLFGIQETNEEKIVNILRKFPVKKLIFSKTNQTDSFKAGEKRLFGPVVERESPNAFISDTPENIIKSGNYNKVPMIIGYTSREGLLFELFRKMMPLPDFPNDFVKEVDFQFKLTSDEAKLQEMGRKVKEYYFGNEDPGENNIDSTALLKTDTMFVHQIQRTIRMHRNTSTEPIYLYRLSLETNLNVFKKLFIAKSLKSFFVAQYLSHKIGSKALRRKFEKLANRSVGNKLEGVSHADDVAYLFKTVINPRLIHGSKEEDFMMKFVTLWTNFAKTGNPTPKEINNNYKGINFTWEPLDDELTYLEIGDYLKLDKHPDKERMEFWKSLLEEYSEGYSEF